MAERRLGLPAAEQQSCSHAAVRRLIELPALKAALGRAAAVGRRACLSGYVAMRGELDPAAGLELARAAGFQVALPRIASASPPHLIFHQAGGPADLCDGPHGLSEPLASCPEVAIGNIDLMLVPGLAFDANGRRLGMGGGYYDDAGRRLRAAGSGGVMVALGYDFQVIDVCPADENDVAVDYVVTEQRVLAARAA
jgi:5-formyltetrahydrofolate cyclo-ligase